MQPERYPPSSTAEDECAAHGHDWTITVDGLNRPRVLTCVRCTEEFFVKVEDER